jgi:hypothetical protein
VILALFLTLVIETFVAAGFCYWRRKPFKSIFLTTSLANLLTQSMLWLALNLLYRHYLPALFIAEIIIWLIESAALRLIPSNRLAWREAALLSLAMNLASFGIGWFLPA